MITNIIPQLVLQGTDPTLEGTDWAKNMEICDMINSSKDNTDAEYAARSIRRRMQESDAKIISLSLTLAETCMKNCLRFASAVDQGFMDEMVGITRSAKGRENGLEALRMIQEWARGIPQKDGSNSACHDTYKAMRNRGITFPEVDHAEAIFDIQVQTDIVRPRVHVEYASKLEQDLATVFEQIKLCREMLAHSHQSQGKSVTEMQQEEEALSEVIGFLEACRDRFSDLIEAGLRGMLSDGLLTHIFRANEAIFRTLEAEKTGETIPIEDGADDLANTVNMMRLNDSPVPRREQQSKSSPTMPPTASSYNGMPAPYQTTYDVSAVPIQSSQFASQPAMGFVETGYSSSQPLPAPYASSQPPPPPPPPPPSSTGPPNFYSSRF